MAGYQSKKAAALDKLNDDDGNALLIAYQSGYYDGKKAALADEREECAKLMFRLDLGGEEMKAAEAIRARGTT